MGIEHAIQVAEEMEARIAFRLAYRIEMAEREKLALWLMYAPILHNPGPGPEDD